MMECLAVAQTVEVTGKAVKLKKVTFEEAGWLDTSNVGACRASVEPRVCSQ